MMFGFGYSYNGNNNGYGFLWFRNDPTNIYAARGLTNSANQAIGKVEDVISPYVSMSVTDYDDNSVTIYCSSVSYIYYPAFAIGIK